MTSGVMMMVGSFVGVSCPQEYVMFFNFLFYFFYYYYYYYFIYLFIFFGGGLFVCCFIGVF